MNILYPVGGRGERFKDVYNTPKPLVLINGYPMIYYAIKTLGIEAHYIFVVLRYEEDAYNKLLYDTIKSLKPESTILYIDKPTEGSAITCLVADNLINNDDELIITNCDQYLNWDHIDFLKFIKDTNPDSCVSTYEHENVIIGEKSPYCFVSLDKNGWATEFCEKFAISKYSMNGIHYWKKGSDFVETIKLMLNDNIKYNNEYYISGSFNYLIKKGKKILIYKMKKNEFYSIGTPKDIENNMNYIK